MDLQAFWKLETVLKCHQLSVHMVAPTFQPYCEIDKISDKIIQVMLHRSLRNK